MLTVWRTYAEIRIGPAVHGENSYVCTQDCQFPGYRVAANRIALDWRDPGAASAHDADRGSRYAAGDYGKITVARGIKRPCGCGLAVGEGGGEGYGEGGTRNGRAGLWGRR
jgi:hypothetical protein